MIFTVKQAKQHFTPQPNGPATLVFTMQQDGYFSARLTNKDFTDVVDAPVAKRLAGGAYFRLAFEGPDKRVYVQR